MQKSASRKLSTLIFATILFAGCATAPIESSNVEPANAEAGKGEDKEADQGRMPHSAHRLAVANPRSIPTW